MTGSAPERMDDQTPDGSPRLPTWVKFLAIGVVLALILLVLVMLLVGGEHSPGMHGG